MQGVVDGEAFTEKFGVPGDFDVDPVSGNGARPYAEFGGGAHRHGRLADDHRRALQPRDQRVDDGVHMPQISPVLALFLRRADTEEVHVREIDCSVIVRGEVQSARGEVVAQHLSQAGLVKRDLSACEFRDLAWIDVDAENVVTKFGHPGGMCRPEIAGTKYGASHTAYIGGCDELTAKRHQAGNQRQVTGWGRQRVTGCRR